MTVYSAIPSLSFARPAPLHTDALLAMLPDARALARGESVPIAVQTFLALSVGPLIEEVINRRATEKVARTERVLHLNPNARA